MNTLSVEMYRHIEIMDYMFINKRSLDQIEKFAPAEF